MDLQTTVDDTHLRIFAHAAAAKVVRASGPSEARPAPGPRGTHRSQDLLTLPSHEVDQSQLIRLQVVGHPDDRHAKPTAVTMVRIDIEKVALVGKRLRLHADHAPVLPAAQMILVGPPPTRDIRRQRFPADLDGQEFFFLAHWRPTEKTASSAVK